MKRVLKRCEGYARWGLLVAALVTAGLAVMIFGVLIPWAKAKDKAIKQATAEQRQQVEEVIKMERMVVEATDEAVIASPDGISFYIFKRGEYQKLDLSKRYVIRKNSAGVLELQVE